MTLNQIICTVFTVLWVSLSFSQERLSLYIKNDPKEILEIEVLMVRDTDHRASYKRVQEILRLKKTNLNPRLFVAANLVAARYAKHFNKFESAYHYLQNALSRMSPEIEQSMLGGAVRSVLGDFYTETEQYDLAREALETSNRTFEALDAQQAPENIFLNYSRLGIVSMRQKKWNDALSAFQGSIQFGKLAGPLYHSSAINNIGLVYFEQHKYDEALEHFHQALPMVDTSIFSHLIFYKNIQENIAKILIQLGEHEAAWNMLKSVISTRKMSPNLSDQSEAYRAEVYAIPALSSMGNKQEVEASIQRVQRYFDGLTNWKTDLHIDILQKFHMAKIEHYERIADFKSLARATREYMNFNRQLQEFRKKVIASTLREYMDAQSNEFLEKIEVQDKLLLEKERSEQQKFRILLITIITAIVVILALLLLVRLRKISQKKTQLVSRVVALENEKLQYQLETKQKDLVNSVVQNDMSVKFQTKILDMIKEVSDDLSPDARQLIRPIEREIKSQMSLEKRLNMMNSDLSQVNSVFHQMLINRFPELTKSEREVCSLIRLNLSIKEIAQLRGCSNASVKMLRSRIRQKLSVDRSEELDAFIQGI